MPFREATAFKVKLDGINSRPVHDCAARLSVEAPKFGAILFDVNWGMPQPDLESNQSNLKNVNGIFFDLPGPIIKFSLTMKQHPKLFDLENPNEWIDHQVKRDKISDRAFRSMVQKLARAMYHNCDLVVRPEQALLLYPQCTAGSTQSAQKESRGPGFVKKRFLEYSDWNRVDKGHWRVTFGKYRPRHSLPRNPEKTSFRYAASLIEWPFTSLASWKLFHLYSGEIPFQGQSEILDARTNRFHWTQTAGMILLHPILAKLWKRCGCLVMALRARAFAELHYDPAGFFSEAEHDRFGFVRDVPVQNPKFANDKTLDSFRILTAPADLDEVGPEDEYFLMAAD